MLKFIKDNEDKSPVTKFDTTYTSLDSLDNASIKLNSKVVVVDFDSHDKEEKQRIKNIINYFDINYPTFKVESTRGYHLYYRIPKGVTIKNWNNVCTTYGMRVDYKTGTTSKAVIKQKGKLRKTNRPLEELKFKDLPELPKELYPIIKSKDIIMMCLGEGGRDDAIFKHLLNVKETVEDIDLGMVANFINDNLFLKPLPKKQLNTKVSSVIERKANDNGYYNGDPKDMISFGEFIAKELDIKIYNGNLYFKDGLNYSKNKIKLNKEINKHLKLRRAQMTELEAQLYIYSELIDDKQKFPVKLRNGVIVEDNVLDYDCGFTPFYLDVNYDTEAYDENVDNFLDFICLGRKDMRKVIEEILGHILLVDKFPHKIFFLTGDGANGKSTFVEMLTNWTGDLSSHIDISSFDDGTSLTSLIGKIVNVADDVDAIYLEKSKNLKTMASGNTVGARAIYSQPITLKNTATLIFTANEPPVFKDKSNGIGRRLVIIPFDNKVKKRVYNLDELLSTEKAKSYLLNLGLQGIKRIYDNKLEISISETIENATKQYYIDNDSVLAYLNEYPDIENHVYANVYSQYDNFCTLSNLKAVSKISFTKRLKSIGYTTRLKTKNGKTDTYIER